MSVKTEHRKLAAIMFTDMVGDTALTQRNIDASVDKQFQARTRVHAGGAVH